MLLNIINEEIKKEMKSKVNPKRLSVLRLVKSEIQNHIINTKDDTDQSIEKVIRSEVKKRKNIVEGNKPEDKKIQEKTEYIDNIKYEIEVLSEFIPQEITDIDTIKSIISKISEEKGLQFKKDKKELIKLLPDNVNKKIAVPQIDLILM